MDEDDNYVYVGRVNFILPPTILPPSPLFLPPSPAAASTPPLLATSGSPQPPNGARCVESSGNLRASPRDSATQIASGDGN
ncbi:hypothetical protein E2C01_016312 [Portunus trituberculatus]|uniref:Uncharacterized protein n=1 Tax=Portunus trituberculatus TaxID=210409 RepID=A0A5B7DNT9_PORTR|nr:hypothetical protein [Portunus trituberculatus]